jgi:glycosyltransferase involved in cell wall biosynthesis
LSSTDHAITVIIPTLALAERSALIDRAIESVHAQREVRAIPLVVVNGHRHDEQVLDALKRDKRIRMLIAESADLPGALRLGRANVETQWVGTLDDDDLLLPDALSTRLLALRAHPGCVAVVTNGLRRDVTGDSLHLPDFSAVRRNPLRSLLISNWLLPGSWLGQTSAFDDEVFRRMPRYLECTYLAMRMATTHQTCFLDQPTMVWSAGTPHSLSRSREYELGMEVALSRILELDLPADVRYGFRLKLAAARNAAASLHLKEGNRRAAWQNHLRALRGPASWRFLGLTSRLIFPPRVRVRRA